LLNEAAVCGYPKIYGSGHLKNPEVVKGSLVLFIFVPWYLDVPSIYQP